MYIIHNLTTNTNTTCDALEFITIQNGKYVPIEQDVADGFRALTIVHESDTQEHYTEEVYVFEGHTLLGNEPIGIWEDAPEESEPEENDP